MNIGKAPLLIAAFVGGLFLLWEFVLEPMSNPAPGSGRTKACHDMSSSPKSRIAACSRHIGANDPPSPGLEAMLCARAAAYADDGQADRAKADIRRAFEMYPASSCANSATGRLLMAEKKYDEAIAAYGKALDGDSLSLWLWHDRAQAKLAKGDRDGAIADFKKSVSIDTGFQPSLRELKKLGIQW